MELLSESHIESDGIILEITESRLDKDLDLPFKTLNRLHLQGILLSIDDISAGYSDLSQLQHIPFGEIKIDRRFINSAKTDPVLLAIIESSTVLATKLDMQVVAEGVETIEQWNLALDEDAIMFRDTTLPN